MAHSDRLENRNDGIDLEFLTIFKFLGKTLKSAFEFSTYCEFFGMQGGVI